MNLLSNYIFDRILLILLVIVCVSCRQVSTEKTVMDSACIPSDYYAEAETWVDSVMMTMSLEEQVGQLFMPSSYAFADDYTVRQLRKYIADNNVGGILFLKGDVHSQAFLSDMLQSISRIPLFIGIDAEWGLSMRFSDAPKFPVNSLLGETEDDQLMYDYGREVGREAQLLGINMVLGPVLDVLTNSKNRVIGKRAFSDNPQIVAEMAVAYARGLEDANVLSIGKHFPGHGATMMDSHKELPIVSDDILRLDTVDFLPFKEYVKNNLSGVMVGHLYMPAIDTVKRSASLSPVVITDFLKTKLGFEGLILTDAINMGGVSESGDISVSAILAGADIIVSPRNTSAEIESVLDAIRHEVIPYSMIKDKCRKILFFKYKVGLNEVEEIEVGAAVDNVNSPLSVRMIERLDSAVNSVN